MARHPDRRGAATAVLVVNHELAPEAVAMVPALDIAPVARFDGAVVADENFRIYQVTRRPPPAEANG